MMKKNAAVFSPAARRGLSMALLFLLLLAPACLGGRSAAPEQAPPATTLTENTTTRADGSLPVDAVDYQWYYFNNGAHIRVLGKARNNGAEPLQAVTFKAVIYDENGRPMAEGSCFLSPTFLAPGAEADFEIVGLPSRTSGIQYINLVTLATVLR